MSLTQSDSAWAYTQANCPFYEHQICDNEQENVDWLSGGSSFFLDSCEGSWRKLSIKTIILATGCPRKKSRVTTSQHSTQEERTPPSPQG